MSPETDTEEHRLRAENERLRAAILDIDAHATGMGEDKDGFVTGGYIVSVGALHRALGVVGHTAVDCRYCDPPAHDCLTVLGATEEVVRLRRQVAVLDALMDVCQRIRAGWLPHRLKTGSWWWGRPSSPDGFVLWSTGDVPTMAVVEEMTAVEIDAWMSSLHPMAQERFCG